MYQVPILEEIRLLASITPHPMGSRSPHSPVGYGGLGSFPLVAGDVLVQVGQAAGHGFRYVAHLAPGHHVALQVVRQRALRTTTCNRGHF